MQRTQPLSERQRPAAPAIGGQLARYAPIGLSQLDAVALLNRTDTKYVLSTAQLARALGALAGQYRVLEIDGARLSPYQTIYFDTPDFALYLAHHAGRRSRYKVRSRRYEATGASFLEIKRKTGDERTEKRRVPTAALATACTPEVDRFVAAHVAAPVAGLEPKLRNEFSRVTLASIARAERLTLDIGLRFSSAGAVVALPGVAIAEVKQAGLSRGSPFVQQMHAASIQSTGFSKYCIGVALLYPRVKHNMFKPKLRLLEQLMGVPCYVD